MKKIFLFSLGLGFSFWLGMSMRSWAFTSDEDFLDDLFSKADVQSNFGGDYEDLEDLAANSKAPFANLYLFMVQNMMEAPKKAAIEELAARTSYTEGELEDILFEGNLDTLRKLKEAQVAEYENSENQEQALAQQTIADEDFEEFKSSNQFSATLEAYLQWKYEEYVRPEVLAPEDFGDALIQEGLLNEYLYLSGLYDHEYSFQRESRKLGYTALANEMFYNNDLQDSAQVDLLYDLDLVHYLLFGDYIVYPDRSGEEAVDLASEEEEPIRLAEENTEEITEAVPFNPYACFDDQDLASALETFENSGAPFAYVEPPSSGIDYEVGGAEGSGSDGGGAGEGDGGSEGGGESGYTPIDVGAAMKELDGFITALSGSKGDWSRALPCNEVFCITVDLVTAGEESSFESEDYEETDNCIACHTIYIQQHIEETTSKSLVPSKVSMNWFEDASCKEAGRFVNLDLNIYGIKKPIDLDPGDSIQEQSANNVENLKTELFQINGIPLGGEGDTPTKTVSDLSCQSILNLYELSGSSSTISEALTACQEAADVLSSQVKEIFDKYALERAEQNTTDLYTQVSAELYSMLLYFQRFQEGLRDSYESSQAPLSSLLTKGYCE